MAGLNLSLADAVLKDDYQGPVRKQINDQCKLTSQAIKNRRDFVGRRAVIPCQITRNTGVGARLEGEVLPTAGNQGYVDQLVNVKSNYGRIRLTRQVISRMQSDQGAFIRAVESEMNGIRDDAARDYNRQAWGLSTGAIATCGTTTASTTVQLASTTPEQVLVSIAEGMVIDIGALSSGALTAVTNGTSRTVTAVDFTNKTITIDAAGGNVTTSGSHSIFRAGSAGSDTYQREITGLQQMVLDGGTLFGISGTTYFQWASIAERNGSTVGTAPSSGGTSRPLSENLVAKAMMRAENRSGKRVNQLWAEDGVYRYAVNLLSAQKRFVNATEVTGGLKGIAFAIDGDDTPLIRDRDCPPNVLYGLCTDELIEYVDEDWKFEDLDGSVLSRSPDSTHTFEAYWFKFSEFATTRRNAHFLIADLDVA